MKIKLLLTALITMLIMSCNNKSKTSKKAEGNQQTEQTNTESYTLQKVIGFRNEDNPDYLIYENKQDGFSFEFHTKKTIDYGVLEKYSEVTDRSDYYIFPKQTNLNDQIKVNLKDALFVKKSNELHPEYPDWTTVDLLLKNYIILGFRGDLSHAESAIINVNKQTVSNIAVHGSFKVSEDEKFLIGWKGSEKKG